MVGKATKLLDYIDRKPETKLQQIPVLMFSSSILTVTGKSDFQFSKFYTTSTALEPNIPSSEHATVIWINQNKVLGCFVLVLSRVVLELLCVVFVSSHVMPCCTCVISCCTCVVVSWCILLYSCCLALCCLVLFVLLLV